MAIKKNAEVAAPAKEKAPAKSAAAKVVKVEEVKAAPAVETLEKAVVISRKDIAAALRGKVSAAGMAISQKVAEVVSVAYEEVISEALAEGSKVSLPGFGVFSVVHREESERPNPQKPGEKVVVPAHNAPKFKPGSKLKAAVNGGEETESDE